MSAVTVTLIEDHDFYEVYELVSPDGRTVTRIELAKSACPAVLYAHRTGPRQYDLGWRRLDGGHTPVLSRAATTYLLRQTGLRDQLHPFDAMAFLHYDQADYDSSAWANQHKHGHAVHGPFPVEGTGLLIQVVDLTAQLRACGAQVTDPMMIDLYDTPCCELHGRGCEPPSELCCAACTEAEHPRHALLGPCSNPDLSGNGSITVPAPRAATLTRSGLGAAVTLICGQSVVVAAVTAERLPAHVTAQLLRRLCLRDLLHPDDVFGYVYPDAVAYTESAASAVAAGNAAHGPYGLPIGIVGFIDVTPQLRAQGCPVTDPRLPDRLAGWCCDLHGRNCEPPSELCCGQCTEADHPGHRMTGPCSAPDLS